MVSLVQCLVQRNNLFDVVTRCLCDKHVRAMTDQLLVKQPGIDNYCEACLDERHQQFIQFAERQIWLPECVIKHSRVYISGPMTGKPNHNKPAFHRMERLLSRSGMKVLSPANYSKEHTYEWYMERDLRMVMDATATIMLLGWKKSRGASAEYEVAVITGRTVYYEQ